MQLTTPLATDLPIHLNQTLRNSLLRHRTRLHRPRQLQKLAQTNHLIPNHHVNHNNTSTPRQHHTPAHNQHHQQR